MESAELNTSCSISLDFNKTSTVFSEKTYKILQFNLYFSESGILLRKKGKLVFQKAVYPSLKNIGDCRSGSHPEPMTTVRKLTSLQRRPNRGEQMLSYI